MSLTVGAITTGRGMPQRAIAAASPASKYTSPGGQRNSLKRPIALAQFAVEPMPAIVMTPFEIARALAP
jgi:hypothetical protein